MNNEVKSTNINSIEKTLEEIKESKKNGNNYFLLGNYKEAIYKYNKALTLRPKVEHLLFDSNTLKKEEEEEEKEKEKENDIIILFASIYSNKSFSHIYLNEFEEALQDAIYCTELRPKWAKGRYRKADALYNTGRLIEALKEWKLCYKLLDTDDTTTLLDLQQRISLTRMKLACNEYYPKLIQSHSQFIQNREKQISKREEEINKVDEKTIKECLKEEKIEVRFINAKRGKGLFATQFIEPETIVFVETPLLAIQANLNKRFVSACSHCLISFEEPIENLARSLGLRRTRLPDEVESLPSLEKEQIKKYSYPLFNSRRRFIKEPISLSGDDGDKRTKEIEEIIKCDECSALFCSSLCREKARGYHSLLCSPEIVNTYSKESISKEKRALIQLKQFCRRHNYETPLVLARIIATIAFNKSTYKKKDNEDICTVKCTKIASYEPWDLFWAPIIDDKTYHKEQDEERESILTSSIQSEAQRVPKRPQIIHPIRRENTDILYKAYNLTKVAIINSFEGLDEELTFKWYKRMVGVLSANMHTVAPLSPFMLFWYHIKALSLEEQHRILEPLSMAFVLLQQKGKIIESTNGYGLFELACCMNHSCDPNVEVRYWDQDAKMTVRTIKSIEPDEELCVAYIPIKGNVHSRRARLQNTYSFLCECTKCIAELKEEQDGLCF